MTSCPSELSAWIGPSISQANYEVGPDVWKILEQIAPETLRESPDSDKKRLADLSLLSEILLRRAGVRNIFQSRLCTHDNAEAFSHRRAAKNNSQESLGARMATLLQSVLHEHTTASSQHPPKPRHAQCQPAPQLRANGCWCARCRAIGHALNPLL